MGVSADLMLRAEAKAAQAKIDRRAARGMARNERGIGKIGVRWSDRIGQLWTAGIIIGLVALATAADRAVFLFLGLEPLATTLVALGVNGAIATIAHYGAARVHAMTHAPVMLTTGSGWHAQVALVVVAAATGVGCVLAIAWARATQLAADAGIIFGGSSIGFRGGLLLFSSIGMALLVVAALISYQRADLAARRAAADPNPGPSRREAARISARTRKLLYGLEAACHAANRDIYRLAARLASEGHSIEEFPLVEIPPDIRAQLEATLARFDPGATTPDIGKAA
jgi:hypothetical protein